ncbi:TTAGGG repeat binding factor [Elasticomyces elasticus]|nr:TTAGGG repeat binding factor [Elasticomyces elasticus]
MGAGEGHQKHASVHRACLDIGLMTDCENVLSNDDPDANLTRAHKRQRPPSTGQEGSPEKRARQVAQNGLYQHGNSQQTVGYATPTSYAVPAAPTAPYNFPVDPYLTSYNDLAYPSQAYYEQQQPTGTSYVPSWGSSQPQYAAPAFPPNSYYTANPLQDVYANSGIDPALASSMGAPITGQDMQQHQYQYQQPIGGEGGYGMGANRDGRAAQQYTEDYYPQGASMHLKLQSLPVMGNMATHIIQKLANSSPVELNELRRGSETEDGQAFSTLKSLFDQTKRVYTREHPFIGQQCSGLNSPDQQEVLRKANIATFAVIVLGGGQDTSLFHLNEYFLNTFVPFGHRLLKWQGALLLELKTQAYISALSNADIVREAVIDDLFPQDMESKVVARHPDTPSLTPSEIDFVDRCKARRQYLLDVPATEEALKLLPKKYEWDDFAKDFAAYLNKNVDLILNPPARATGNNGFLLPAQTEPASGYNNGSISRQHQSPYGPPSGPAAQNQFDSAVKSATLAAQTKPSVTLPTHDGHPQKTLTSSPLSPTSPSGAGQVKAKDSEVSKSGATPKSSNTFRQPWRKDEEDALLSGLEMTNGPHWSQILALFGPGGTVSEALKDRNQVQLKDKARNLKLWYLKMGKAVPVALRGVTGSLGKRGGLRVREKLLTGELGPDGVPRVGSNSGRESSAAYGALEPDAGGGAEMQGDEHIDPALD